MAGVDENDTKAEKAVPTVGPTNQKRRNLYVE